MNWFKYSIPVSFLFLAACGGNGPEPDAYGNFEADEVLVSAMVPGELLEFNVEDGQRLEAGVKVGQIDTTDLLLQQLEVQANIELINSQYNNLAAQIRVLETEKANIEREVNRVTILVEKKAATSQQLDDLSGKLKVIQNQIKTIEAQNPTVVGQVKVANAKLNQIKERLSKSEVINPMNGVVLNKIANQYELVGPGAPLYKLANLSTINFRAYITGNQLSSVKLGESYTLKVDGPDGSLLEFPGTVTWVSAEAEFTPKIIQTREERVDMVYAVKLSVKNDGSLKIGMPGELFFNSTSDAEGQ